jgi:hypothetical protein
MRIIIEELTKRSLNIVDCFVSCRERWKVILQDIHAIDVAQLATRLTDEQFYFESICGNHHQLGKTIICFGQALRPCTATKNSINSTTVRSPLGYPKRLNNRIAMAK